MAPRTAKPAAAKPAKAKPAAKSATNPTERKQAGPAAPIVKLKELVEAVASASGAKKPDAKAMIEATLTSLATALKAGKEFNLPPLGRARIVKSVENSGTTILTLKLRMSGPGTATPKQALAEGGEDS